ncbi:hypothetical protein TanjilG_10064 [Lupinus angustifolius]|uniref:Uncharacterized protein n=1 Tax=Lupinus angustifolius TaxID=3871 RepID=A0A1J7GTK9_LUPAN|nr:hypothetical protein TanjilG_10064 [Lupinus angustifolius]
MHYFRKNFSYTMMSPLTLPGLLIAGMVLREDELMRCEEERTIEKANNFDFRETQDDPAYGHAKVRRSRGLMDKSHRTNKMKTP